MAAPDRDPEPLSQGILSALEPSRPLPPHVANDFGGGPPLVPFWLRRKTIHNEQTKLLATAISNVAVAFFVTAIVAPLVGYAREPSILTSPDPMVVALVWLLTAAMIHLVARLILTGLEP